MADVAEVLFSSDAGGVVTAWDARAGTVLQSFRGAAAHPRTLCLLGADFLLAAEPGKALVRAWSLTRGEQTQLKMVSPGGPVTALACSPCGNWIAGGVSGDVAIWQAATGLQVAVLSGHFQRVSCLAFTDDSALLASAAEDGHVRVHRLAAAVSGKPSELWTFQDHGAAVRDMDIGKGGAKSLLASVAADRTLRVYSLASGQLLLTVTFESGATAVTLAADLVLVGLSSGQIRGHRLSSGSSAAHLTLNGHEGAVTCLSTSIDGRLVASGGQDGRLLVWDAPSGQMLRTLTQRGAVTAAILRLAPMWEGAVPSLVLQTWRRALADDEELVVGVRVKGRREAPPVVEEGEASRGEEVEGRAAKINKQLVQFCVKNILKPQQVETAKT